VRIGCNLHSGEAEGSSLLAAKLLAPAEHLAGMHTERPRHTQDCRSRLQRGSDVRRRSLDYASNLLNVRTTD
jgi:hypothetical protein